MGGRGWGLFLGFCFFCFFSFLGGSEGISSYAPSDSVLCKYSRRTNLTAASERRSPFLKTELVLSVCQENLSWLEPEEISKFSAVTLYKKCHQETVNDLPDEYPNIRGRVSLQTMKNRGSCDGTYLHHILTHWDTLAEHIVFYKGSLCPTCYPSHFIRDDHPDYECCPGNMFSQPLDSFSLKKYLFSNNPDLYQNIFRQFRGRNGTMGSWMEEIFGSVIAERLFQTVKNHNFCSRGFFAVSRDHIKKYPKYLFEALHSYQKYSMEEVDHYLERTWYSLFHFQGSIRCGVGRRSEQNTTTFSIS